LTGKLQNDTNRYREDDKPITQEERIMTIYIESEEQALEDLDTALFEIETWEVSEAIKRACRVDINDLIRED
jgi:hypothetical protein